ncbi:MAG: hypothetical protein U0804_16645 [Gemmataceae bacterium]
MSRPISGAVGLLAGVVAATAAAAQEPASDFPPVVAEARVTVTVGDAVTVGGPKAVNFLPNETYRVYVVPHRVWRDGDPLAEPALATSQARSNAEGTLLKTTVWKAVRAGRFDIVVDYDGDGKFSYALDAVDGVNVRDM